MSIAMISLPICLLLGMLCGYAFYPWLMHRMLAREIDKGIDHLLDDMYGGGDDA